MTPQDVIQQCLDARERLRNNGYWGPIQIVVPLNTPLDAPYAPLGVTLRDRIMQLDGIAQLDAMDVPAIAAAQHVVLSKREVLLARVQYALDFTLTGGNDPDDFGDVKAAVRELGEVLKEMLR